MLQDEDTNATDELALAINIKVCADCHAFLEHAARLLRREIRVLEPSRRHTFPPSRGGCSCGGRGY